VVVVSCCRCRPRAKRSLVADGGGSLRRQFDHGGVRHGDRIRRGRQLLGLSGHDERMAERAHRLASEKTPSVLRISQKTYSAGLNNHSHGPAPYPAKDRSRVCFGRHRVGGLEKISRSWLGCAIFVASSSRSLAPGWAVGSLYPGRSIYPRHSSKRIHGRFHGQGRRAQVRSARGRGQTSAIAARWKIEVRRA
jgi:hypothetical protein